MAYLYFAFSGVNVAFALMQNAPTPALNLGAAVALFGYGLIEALKR